MLHYGDQRLSYCGMFWELISIGAGPGQQGVNFDADSVALDVT